MPPVRWKLCFYVMTILVQVAMFGTTAQQMQQQDSISMSSDGWRPIVGTRRQQSTKPEQEITQYANPNRGFDIIPVEVLNIETTTMPLARQLTVPQKATSKHNGGFKERKIGLKIKHTNKTPSPYFLPSGPHQTSVSGTQQQLIKKMQLVKKPMMVQKARKPIRGQAIAHSSRNEIFVPPPSPNSGGYNFVKPANNIKTREAQGFGLLGNTFGLSQQQNAHIELGRFPLTGENILQRPTFFLAKPLQNDEFTRNLVPPARGRLQQKTKGVDNTKISLYAFKEGPATDATSNVARFGPRPNQFLPQVSPTFDFSTSQQQQQQKTKSQQQTKEQAVEVQVTKENLKQYSSNGGPGAFSSFPGRNSFPIGYVDYSFQKPRPQDPNTYEVTEGKWLDTPSQQYQFRPQDGFFQFQNLRQPQPNARPGLLFQSEVSTQRPPIFQSPLIDLSVPAFLPTPYKPENSVIPTSPTQSEAATVFNQVSNKMNRYRTNALKEQPLFFDIKDVSTHYPILGTPIEGQSEGNTDSPLPMNDNGEISNEITTHRERTRRPTKEPTQSTSTRDPTKSRITNRRRPRPRKPTTTTTTEESVVETYQSIKSQEDVEEAPIVETERPQRRRRPKPTSYRTQESQLQDEREQNKKRVEEELPNRQRGRYRFRTRERPATERSDTNVIQRKRLRPTYSENTIKERQQQYSVEETTEVSVEQYSFEREPSVEEQHSYSQEQSEEAQRGQSQQYFQTVEQQQEEPVSRPFIEEIHPASTRLPVTATTQEESNTFHIPDNEIDYTTQEQLQDVSEEVTTTTTQEPTTTAETTTSLKSTRIRRPSKYDSSNRPRFSVKDYRQRLNQYTSTTPSTTTYSTKTSADGLKLRFPSRLRTRPSPTTASSRVDEDVTDEPTTTVRSRFKPKDPRHQATTESDLIITEKTVKAVNTRLRPFGRIKATTEATTAAPKVSIRPNLFSARKRGGYPSLRARIQNKLKKNETEDNENQESETTTTEAQNEVEEDNEPLNVAESVTTELSTTTDLIENQPSSEESTTEAVDDITEDIMKNDESLYSQRVSDLTSSFKDYDKPGVFNSVAPTSRSIPNYFTISTDDPILPIEAFFPNLNKEKTNKDR